ncbi:MAG: translesion error-prone DNA polymerase V autoproteolytic subunit [Bacteroidales bacterium]|nr:translesion error-prone DNA polymerase V autoproteolytic subunit [Bacteroidales bacterium]MCF8405408.1 translesion error-prone DNA polymerase V autoproteolytic subunit [Bacteroidales bacterium]
MKKQDKTGLPLFSTQVPAGFPSPAEDFMEKRLDLNDYLVKNKASTFLVKVHGHSMKGAGIFDGDVVVVDRALEASTGKIILGVLNGEFTIKRLLKKKNKLFLAPENEDFTPVEITPETDFRVWGIVTFVLHKL